MKKFDAAVLRLKSQVGMTEDQAVASLLGLSKASFSDRKRRDSFPADKLRALAQQRPDLKIDVEYVLTGIPASQVKPIWLRLKAQLGWDDDEQVAGWMGMDVAQVSAFTRRGAFPVQQLKDACEKHPGVVDLEYVLTGVGMAAQSIISDVQQSLAAGASPASERQIVELYRSNPLFRRATDALVALASEKA